MAFLFLFFTVVLSLCVVGLIVLALASILGSVRDDWKLEKPKRKPRPGDYWSVTTAAPILLGLTLYGGRIRIFDFHPMRRLCRMYAGRGSS
jgi:hypothetical protein